MAALVGDVANTDGEAACCNIAVDGNNEAEGECDCECDHDHGHTSDVYVMVA